MAISALDLLSMSDNEQTILRCLSKRPRLTVVEVATITKLPADEVEKTLEQMVKASQLVEQLTNGKRTFAVRFKHEASRQVRNLPANLLAILDQPNDNFLAEVVLTSALSPQERNALTAKSVSRKLMADEVFVWQGRDFGYVGVIRSGLLKKSRLQGKTQTKQTTGYIRRAEWFGLSEMLNKAPSLSTYTAAVESELILWPVAEFLEFIQHNPTLGLAISRILSEELQQCQNRHVRGLGRLWVIESLRPQAGATTVAVNLATLAAQNNLGNGHRARVVLWNVAGDNRSIQQALGRAAEELPPGGPEQETYLACGDNLDILVRAERGDYPPQAQLDILLTKLQTDYDYIVCDLAATAKDEFALQLCGQADVLIMLLGELQDLAQGLELRDLLQAYSRPNQKQMFALNRVPAEAETPDPALQVTLPEDPASLQAALDNHRPVVQTAPDSPLGQALQEVYRRLSLTHVIGVFIPSTVDVDQTIDNSQQIQAALSFFGEIFGGAISNRGDGVWRSEDSGLVVEQVTVVRAFVSEDALQKHLDDVVDFATNLKKEMKQEAVAIDVDNQLVLV